MAAERQPAMHHQVRLGAAVLDQTILGHGSVDPCTDRCDPQCLRVLYQETSGNGSHFSAESDRHSIHVVRNLRSAVCVCLTEQRQVVHDRSGVRVRGSILEWIDGYRLNGAVESLAVLKNNSKEQQKDAILLTYRSDALHR